MSESLFPIFSSAAAAAAAKSLQSCPTLCDPTDGSPPGSTVPGILQARSLEWAAISFSNAWNWKVKVKSHSKCPTLRDPMDYSLPVSSVHGIFQARVLEWVAIVVYLLQEWIRQGCQLSLFNIDYSTDWNIIRTTRWIGKEESPYILDYRSSWRLVIPLLFQGYVNRKYFNMGTISRKEK